MPIYEYRCPKCRASFEKLRRIAEAETPTECPSCGAHTQDLQFSSFATGSCGSGNGRGGFT